MQLTSIIVLLSGALSASAFPGKLLARQAEEAKNSTGPANADFACNQADGIIQHQFAEISKLKAGNISVPPYLAGYYSAIDSGRREIGCPGSNPFGRRDTAALKEPCDVVNDQHERMMVLVNKFVADKIGIAPYIAGFLSATLDGQKGLGCPPFTGPATEAALSSSSNSTDSSNPAGSSDSTDSSGSS